MARPRNADAEATKQRILEAAIERFGQDGLKGASLRAIGGDAGVTFATVHHYFGGKAELYERCLDASYEDLAGLRAALGEALLGAGDSLDDKLGALAKRAYEFAREHARRSRFLLRATLYEAAGRERAQASQRQYLDVTSEVLAPVVGRPAQELRVPLQGLMFLLTRLAVMSDDERAILTGAGDPARTEAQLVEYMVAVARATLLPEGSPR